MSDIGLSSSTHLAPTSVDPNQIQFEPKDMRKALTAWAMTSQQMRVAHREAAVSYGRLSRGFGAAVALLSAIVGTSAFAQLAQHSSRYVAIATGTLGMLAAGLAAVQTALGFGSQQESNRAAASEYARINIEIKELLAANFEMVPPDEKARLCAQFDALSKELAVTEGKSPEIANRFIVRARNNLEARKHW